MSLHYDYEVRWENFRGFADTKWVRFAPVTIILGANNAGKSSLLAPLLMMRQTMSSRDSDTPLISRGRNIDAGFYRDYVHRGEVERDIRFSFKYHTHPRKEELDPVGTYQPGMFRATFEHVGPAEDVRLKRYELFDIYERRMLDMRYNGVGYEIIGSLYSELSEEEKKAIAVCSPINFVFSPTSALYYIQALRKKSKEIDNSTPIEKISDSFNAFINATSFAFEEIRSKFDDIFFIGPHRDYPSRAYEYLGDKPSSVGKEGEYFASILKRDQKRLVPVINKWLRQLGIGHSIEVRDLSDDMFSITLNTTASQNFNIADLGYGISQIFPVIVQLLSAEPDSLTIVEQPELHLNPKLQRSLANLLAGAAENDTRVVVETHSEHLLMGLRTLVAEGRIQPSDVAIYYVDRTGKSSKVRQIEIDDLGHITPDDWPKDFFTEGLEGALELSRAQRRAIRNDD